MTRATNNTKEEPKLPKITASTVLMLIISLALVYVFAQGIIAINDKLSNSTDTPSNQQVYQQDVDSCAKHAVSMNTAYEDALNYCSCSFSSLTSEYGQSWPSELTAHQNGQVNPTIDKIFKGCFDSAFSKVNPKLQFSGENAEMMIGQYLYQQEEYQRKYGKPMPVPLPSDAKVFVDNPTPIDSNAKVEEKAPQPVIAPSN